MKLKIVSVMLGGMILLQGTALAGEWTQYFGRWGYDWLRGVKNIVGAPLEIPRAVEAEEKSEDLPTVQALKGFNEGFFNMIRRAGSGLWDLLIAPIPGEQEGLLLTPETLI